MNNNVSFSPKHFWAFFLPLTVFTKELGMISIGNTQFDIISFPFFIIAFIIFLLSGKISLSKNELFVFLYILSIGILNILLFNLPFQPFFKQLIPIILIYFSSKYIIQKYGVEFIFDKYIQYTIVIAIIGLLQISLKLLGINFLAQNSDIYIDSIALEPSHYALIVLPALIFLYETRQFTWKFYLILLTLILTFKLTALSSIILYLLIRNISFRNLIKFLVLTILLSTLFIFIINNIPEFSHRISTLLVFFETRNIGSIQNLTTFSFISNLEIAMDNFIHTFGFGIGLGGHETMYLRNFNANLLHPEWYGMNYNSAHSLIIRLISELGLLGISLYVILIKKTSQIKNPRLSAIAWGSVSFFIAKMIKLGGYFDYGTLFFLIIIIIAIKSDKIIASRVSV